MKTFEEAIDSAANALEAAEKRALRGDNETAREMVAVAQTWVAVADRIDAARRPQA
jgi:hypothetical protein